MSAPIAVSPLIKAARWTALLTGVAYGSWRLKRLQEYDAPVREKMLLEKKNELEQKRIQKEINDKETMKYLSSITGADFGVETKSETRTGELSLCEKI
ncbi:hypothetical protein SNEBB_007292 [Seison nebaliae]|nr:hypothetical protein SNEBB_007292 [Seison nebaliae]